MDRFNKKRIIQKPSDERGFSIIELLMVLLVISILAVSSILLFSGKSLFYADHQAYLLMDAFKEARQRSLTQQETIRVEVSKERREIRIINENEPGDATDDVIEKRIFLAQSQYLTFDASPNNITTEPQEPTPVPKAAFRPSVHPLSLSENVATLRFLRNGNVVSEGSNEVGDNSVVTGATFYFWKPKITGNGTITSNGEVIRAITVLGSSGNANYWKCSIKNNLCSEWTH